MLRFQEQMKLEEIAKLIKIPLATVKTRLYRGVQALRPGAGRTMAKAITKIEGSITTLKRGASTLNRRVRREMSEAGGFHHAKKWCFHPESRAEAWWFLSRCSGTGARL